MLAGKVFEVTAIDTKQSKVLAILTHVQKRTSELFYSSPYTYLIKDIVKTKNVGFLLLCTITIFVAKGGLYLSRFIPCLVI